MKKSEVNKTIAEYLGYQVDGLKFDEDSILTHLSFSNGEIVQAYTNSFDELMPAIREFWKKDANKNIVLKVEDYFKGYASNESVARQLAYAIKGLK